MCPHFFGTPPSNGAAARPASSSEAMMHSHAGEGRPARNVPVLLGSPAAHPEMVDADEEERRLSLLRLQERLSEVVDFVSDGPNEPANAAQRVRLLAMLWPIMFMAGSGAVAVMIFGMVALARPNTSVSGHDSFLTTTTSTTTTCPQIIWVPASGWKDQFQIAFYDHLTGNYMAPGFSVGGNWGDRFFWNVQQHGCPETITSTTTSSSTTTTSSAGTTMTTSWSTAASASTSSAGTTSGDEHRV